jgi:AcrR family transcriptional regulator
MPARTGPDLVLDATLACIARVGLTKTTLDDVAREAGCARATVYRYFPGKLPLLTALVAREADTLQTQILAAAADARTLADAATVVITTAARTLANHRALVFLTTHEPEVLLPYLAFERESAVLMGAAEMVAPAFTRFLSDAHATRLGEWVARLTLSYLCSPSEHVDVFDAAQVRSLVDDFVLPGFARAAGAFEGASQ